MNFIKNLFGIKSKEEKLRMKNEWDEMSLNLKSKISHLAEPAVQLIKNPHKTNSKLGGKPVADREDFIWPRSGGAPMTFLAQLDLSEISQKFHYDWLPNRGALLFFYDIKNMPWGYDPNDRDKWKVIYQSSPTIEIDTPSDINEAHAIVEQFLSARKIEVLPSYDAPGVRKLNLRDEEIDLYIEIGEHFEEFNSYGDFPAHQIGGLPQPIQGDEMQFEAKMASNGNFMGDGKGYRNATEQDFEVAKSEWKLLFQFDSDEEVNAMWGDLGMLYFWVETEKAKVNDYSDTWLILQCT